MTLGEVVNEYACEHKELDRRSDKWKYFAQEAMDRWGTDRPLHEVVEPSSVKSFIAACREKNNAPATISVKLTFLRALCRLSTEAGTPLSIPKRITSSIVIDNARERTLSDAEMGALKSAMMREDWEIMECVFRTGLRSQELFLLKVEDCDFLRGFAIILKTKTSKSRKIPLAGWFKDYCKKAKREHREYVAVINGYEHYQCRINAGEAWKQNVMRRALRVAGIKDFRFHDGRHIATTDLIEAGANDVAVQTIMGWTSSNYLRRYTNLRMKTLQDTISLLDKPKRGRRRGNLID